MKPTWLDAYPDQVPASIAPPEGSLVALFDQAVTQYANCGAYHHLGHTVTYAELAVAVNHFAGYLQHELGIEKGQRVALMMPNCFAGMVALFAVLRIGAVVVNVNPLYTSQEIHALLHDAEVSAVVALDLVTAELHAACQQQSSLPIIVASIGDFFPYARAFLVRFVARLRSPKPIKAIKGSVSMKQAIRLGRQTGCQPVAMQPTDLAFLQYTGGTTGQPKGVMLSHGNLLANIHQTAAWFQGHVAKGQEVNVLALPMYHIFSLTVNCLMFLSIGGLNIIVTNPRDLTAFIKQIRHKGITFFVGVNTLLNKLMQHRLFSSIDFSQLKVTVCGGMAVQASVAERWEQVTGVSVLQGYGLTETSPIVAVNPVGNGCYTGAVGLPLPSTDIKVIGKQGEEVAAGEEGELCVAGPQVMQGYWRQLEVTHLVLQSGWLATGDIGYVDERGYLFLKERRDDVIIVSGFNVYPNEVEAVLAAHEKVDEVGVVGIDDSSSGQRVRAFVVALDNSLTEEELKQWCERSLAKYKQPVSYQFCDALPKTPVGKILRRKLR